MEKKNRTTCPYCNGKKVIPGSCVCDREWRGSPQDDGFEECRCEKETVCTNCRGNGYIEN